MMVLLTSTPVPTRVEVGGIDETAKNNTSENSSNGQDVLFERDIVVDWERLVKIKHFF